MNLYTCKVRLGGSVLNEVRKSDVTAPEIIVLREIHGSDAVADIVMTGNVKRSSAEERKRITDLYAGAGENNSETHKKKTDMLRTLFGHESMGLPEKLDEPVAVAPVVEKPQRVKLNQNEAALA